MHERLALVLAALCVCAGAGAGPIRADAPPTADLVVTAVQASASGELGTDIWIHARFTNDGPAMSTPSCNLVGSIPDRGPLVWENGRGYAVSGGNDIADVAACPSLPGSAESLALELQAVRVGTTRVQLTAESPDLADPDPSNNSVTITVTVRPGRSFVELRDPVWSTSGTRVAYARWSVPHVRTATATPATTGRIFVARSDGSHPRPVTPNQPAPYWLAFAPDGHAIAYASGGDLWVADLTNGSVTRVDAAGIDDREPAWSPDGRQIAYLSGDCRSLAVVALVTPSGGAAPRTLGASCIAPVWTPDLRVLVGGMLIDPEGARPGESTEYTQWSRDGTLALAPGHKVVSTRTGAVVWRFKSPPRSTMVQVRLSPSGDRIAAATAKGRVVVESRAHPLPLFVGGGSGSAPPAEHWSSTGRIVYAASASCGAFAAIDAANGDGSHLRTLARACA